MNKMGFRLISMLSAIFIFAATSVSAGNTEKVAIEVDDGNQASQGMNVDIYVNGKKIEIEQSTLFREDGLFIPFGELFKVGVADEVKESSCTAQDFLICKICGKFGHTGHGVVPIEGDFY